MNVYLTNKCLAVIIGLAALGGNPAHASTETEPNNDSSAANMLTIPLKNVRISVAGKLREGNKSVNPPDQDWFKFTSSDRFTSIKVTITPLGIDGTQHVSYKILDSQFQPLHRGEFSGNPVDKEIPSPGGGSYFIQVYDDGNLTSESGQGSYTVSIVGMDPLYPPTETTEFEPNNDSGGANMLYVPFTTNNTGATVMGRLREGNKTATPPDQDWFKFMNLSKFSAMRVRILGIGIDVADSFRWQILDSSMKVLFAGNSNDKNPRDVLSPADGVPYFVRVYDFGDLSSESSQANYLVEVVGVDGMDDLTDDFGNPVPAYQGAPQNFSVKLSRRGRALSDGLDTRMFGSSKVKNKKGRVRSIIITNTGNSPLRKLRIMRDGRNARDFSILSYKRKPLKPGKSVTVKLRFRPKARGPRLAALHIYSSETTNNPFDLNLYGKGTGRPKKK